MAGLAAAELFVLAIGAQPWLVDRHTEQARRLSAQGRFVEAMPHYEYLFKKFPGSPTVNLELGLAALNAKQWDKALDHLLTLANQPDASPGIRTKLGEAYIGLGQREKALAEFNAALKENPNDPVASYYVGDEYFRKGEWSNAAQFLGNAAFDPDLGAAAHGKLKTIERRIFEEPAGPPSKPASGAGP